MAIVDIKGRRESIEELGLLIKRICEGMRSPNGNSDIVTSQRINISSISSISRASCAEAGSTLDHQECFVVHLMPMRWRSHCPRRDDELGGA